jgi:hypothetical protein
MSWYDADTAMNIFKLLYHDIDYSYLLLYNKLYKIYWLVSKNYNNNEINFLLILFQYVQNMDIISDIE